jgi:ABC-type phosphate transport system substrate-binding protein
VLIAYLLVPLDQADRPTAQALVALLGWCLTTGQADAAQEGYAALPGGIQVKALAALHRVTGAGSPIWP